MYDHKLFEDISSNKKAEGPRMIIKWRLHYEEQQAR